MYNQTIFIVKKLLIIVQNLHTHMLYVTYTIPIKKTTIQTRLNGGCLHVNN